MEIQRNDQRLLSNTQKEEAYSQEKFTWHNRYPKQSNDYFYNTAPQNDDEEVNLFLTEHLNQMKRTSNLEKILDCHIHVYDTNNNLVASSKEGHDSFAQFNLNKILLNNLNLMKFDKLTPIQRAVIGPLMGNNIDIVGCAQTGSGKTVAFLLSIFEKMLKSGPPQVNLNPNTSYPVLLILSPTRELVDQIYKVAKLLTVNTGLRIGKLYGGMPHDFQARVLKAGTDIVVSTTGRILDFLNSGKINLLYVQYLIIDEADRMLDMGFEKQLNEILFMYGMPQKSSRQTLLFSATFSKDIMTTVKGALKSDYYFATNNQEYVASDHIEQKFVYINDNQKPYKLHEILQTCNGSAISKFILVKISFYGS